jgi:hypothetical protein
MIDIEQRVAEALGKYVESIIVKAENNEDITYQEYTVLANSLHSVKFERLDQERKDRAKDKTSELLEMIPTLFGKLTED